MIGAPPLAYRTHGDTAVQSLRLRDRRGFFVLERRRDGMTLSPPMIVKRTRFGEGRLSRRGNHTRVGESVATSKRVRDLYRSWTSIEILMASH
jgi:hypothetical protein